MFGDSGGGCEMFIGRGKGKTGEGGGLFVGGELCEGFLGCFGCLTEKMFVGLDVGCGAWEGDDIKIRGLVRVSCRL